MSSPSTEIKTAGLTYNCVANLRYNSIMIANNAIRPSFTEENGVEALIVQDADDMGRVRFPP